VQNARTRLFTLALLVVAACDGGPSGLTTGNLSITVAGLPAGTAANITVTGPNGYSQSLTVTQTLSQLESGLYTIAASNVTVGTTTYAASPQTQSVSLTGSASRSVVYSASSPTLGGLLVNINGLPSGTDAAVTVTGPNGYNQTVTTTQTLSSLTPGVYTVVPADIVAPGGTTYRAAPTTQDVTVAAASTASATVTYSPPSGGTLNLSIPAMYLSQSTQTLTGTVPLVQNRDGMLRIFVVADQVNLEMPAVRVRFYQDFVFQSEQIIPAPSASVPLSIDESSLNRSWNVPVAGSLIRSGLSIVAEVDVGNTVVETDESDNAFPAAAPQAFTVRPVPTFNITFVPIRQSHGRVGNVTSGNANLFLDAVQRMHPLSTINVAVRAQYVTQTPDTLEDDNGNGAWGDILGELDVLRTVTDQSPRYYYGVADAGYTSGVAGVAYVSSSSSPERVALGWDYLPSGSLVAAHELGHNWARNHAPCGNPSGVDNQYPQADGSTGNYGLDVAANTVKAPTLGDIMGYCDPKWIGSYSYTAVMNYLSTVAPVTVGPAFSAATSSAVQPTLLVWGTIKNGEMILKPAFQVTTRPKLPGRTGPYTLEAVSAEGTQLLSLSFEVDEVADAPGNQKNFVFAVPLASAGIDRIASLRLRGPGRHATITAAARATAGSAQLGAGAKPDSVEVRPAGGGVRLRWNARATPMIMVRDGATGEVLSLARSGDVVLPAVTGDLELVLSDGVRSRVKRVSVR